MQLQNVPERTIRDVIKRYLDTGRTAYQPIPGRSAIINTPRNQKRVLKKCRSKSERVSATELKIARSTYQRVKKSAGIRSRKKRRAPKYKDGQIERCKRGAARLYRACIPSGRNFFVVLDDETYVPKDPTQVAGNHYYMSDDEQETPVEDTLRPTGKFEGKFMVWQAIAEDGRISQPFVADCTVNGQIYGEECIQKLLLLPFIRNLGVQRPVLFWPDLASSHYAAAVISKLTAAGVSYVSKVDNLPNVPQLRPIEKFWALCKHKYQQLNKPANTIPEMKKIWKRISKQVAAESGKSLFKHFRSNLRKCAKSGPVGL